MTGAVNIGAASQPPREETRERLLHAAMEEFGKRGFDGARTRRIADAAGVNLQAIPYHFGSKEGLYIAVADKIGEAVAGHFRLRLEAVMRKLQEADEAGIALTAHEARTCLGELLDSVALLFAGSSSDAPARFLVREQMQPSDAFDRIFRGVMQPVLETTGRLVGILAGEAPHTPYVRLRTVSLLGSLMVVRLARAAVMAHLDWPSIGDREIELIRALAADLAYSLAAGDNT